MISCNHPALLKDCRGEVIPQSNLDKLQLFEHVYMLLFGETIQSKLLNEKGKENMGSWCAIKMHIPYAHELNTIKFKITQLSVDEEFKPKK